MVGMASTAIDTASRIFYTAENGMPVTKLDKTSKNGDRAFDFSDHPRKCSAASE